MKMSSHNNNSSQLGLFEYELHNLLFCEQEWCRCLQKMKHTLPQAKEWLPLACRYSTEHAQLMKCLPGPGHPPLSLPWSEATRWFQNELKSLSDTAEGGYVQPATTIMYQLQKMGRHVAGNCETLSALALCLYIKDAAEVLSAITVQKDDLLCELAGIAASCAVRPLTTYYQNSRPAG